jgi:VWFA-related protein
MAMLSHRQSWLSAAVLFVFPFALFAGRANDTSTIPYRIGAYEVRVTFFATDQSNRLVETVGKDDFAIVDSGTVVRNFRSLTRSNQTALDVVLLVDASESVAPRFQAAMHDALRLISQEPPASDDNISVVSFAGLQPVLVCTRDCRTVAAEHRLRAVKAAGVTPLFDALTYAANLVASGQTPGVRQVLILFSDGNDTISKASARDAVEAVMASDALLYTIDLNDPRHASEGSATLQQMAEATGGRSFSLHEGAVQVLQAALADLRASYLVTYQLPSRAVGFHSLRILPKHNLNLRFHCRSGYYYEKSSS